MTILDSQMHVAILNLAANPFGVTSAFRYIGGRVVHVHSPVAHDKRVRQEREQHNLSLDMPVDNLIDAPIERRTSPSPGTSSPCRAPPRAAAYRAASASTTITGHFTRFGKLNAGGRRGVGTVFIPAPKIIN